MRFLASLLIERYDFGFASQRKEAMYPRRPPLDAAHGPRQLIDRCAVSPSQYTLS